MKVIHLPVNISSQISSTVRALRALGVDARGLARNQSPLQAHWGIESVDWFGRPNPAFRLWRGVRWRWKLVRAMVWADVIHWHWGDTTWGEIDLRIAARLRKPRLVEFWGDDLRDPALASRDNPFLAELYRSQSGPTDFGSTATQKMFRKHGFAYLVPGYELADYVDRSIFPGFYQTRPRVLLDDYTPSFPDPARSKPVLAHAPSNKAKKGTEAVLAALEQLKPNHNFEFKLIHGMPRSEALQTVATADVFLDQFTIGAEGLAALEAMALGKPVVCFIKESLRSRYPEACPIVVSDQNNLAPTLAKLIENGPRRRALGIEGRKYIERYHSANEVARELVKVYEHLMIPIKGSTASEPMNCPYWCKVSNQRS